MVIVDDYYKESGDMHIRLITYRPEHIMYIRYIRNHYN